jgi:DNA-binding transcriptional MerR regulator
VWTLDELVERVGRTLATGYAGAPNGRVRDVPDRRAVRWYTTVGLVDRPAAMHGRTALYGSRHLLQVVAVKRRQAAGCSLADIQAELAGATDTELAAIASVPAELLQDGDRPPAGPVRARFWAEPAARPVAPEPPEPFLEPPVAISAATTQAAATPEAPLATNDAPSIADSPSMADAPSGEASTITEAAAPIAAVALAGGAVLLLPGTPAPGDYREIAAAARPLIDLLARRGLLDRACERSTG